MNSSRSKLLAWLCILAAAAVIPACGGLTRSDQPAVTVWWLEPYTGASPAGADQPPVPLLLTLSVVPGLDSDRILTLSADAELKPYAGARWAEHLPELVASLLKRSLQASGRFEMLQNRPRKGSPGCELQLQVEEFFADRDAGGRTTGVRVAAGGFLRCDSVEPLAVETRAHVAVGAENMQAVVAAFQQATNLMTQELIDKLQLIQ